jgi:hypothetical protein
LQAKDGNSYAEAYKIMTPIIAMIRRLNIGVVCTRHVTKAEGKAMARGMGSAGYAALGRSTICVAVDPKADPNALPVQRLFAHAGSNNSIAARTISFIIENGLPVPGFKRPVGAVVWGADSDTTPDEMMNPQNAQASKGPATAKAESWLLKNLTTDPQEMLAVRASAAEDLISKSTLYRAFENLEAADMVVSRKDGFQGKATWAKLPMTLKNMDYRP